MSTPSLKRPGADMERVREAFDRHLRASGLRQTAERIGILEKVYALDGHFDADQLFLELKKEGQRISRATVYNSLELLVEAHLVKRHQFGATQAKYEKSFGYRQHDHLICLDCSEVMEFCDPRIQGIEDMVAEHYQFSIQRHSLELYGHCNRDECPNRSKKSA